MFAQVYYFEEWRSWAVTVYDAEDNRARDENGDEIEAEWYAYKGQAVTNVEGKLQRREIDGYDVFTRAGHHERTVVRIRRTGEIAETRFPA